MNVVNGAGRTWCEKPNLFFVCQSGPVSCMSTLDGPADAFNKTEID